MIVEKLPVNLRPAAAYGKGNYPNLRRMTDGIRPPYFLTLKAAKQIEAQPVPVLHHRLYDMFEDSVLVYELVGRPICAIQTAGERVDLLAPEELPDDANPKVVQVTADYPAPFLPFDLARAKAVVESKLSSLGTGYQAAGFPETIYLGSCPFAAYETFHFLTQDSNGLALRIKGLKQVLDVGSGLGILSFVISRFISNDARIVGVEMDEKLTIGAARIRKYLSAKLGYDVHNIEFYCRNVTSLMGSGVRLEDCNAVMGFFPLGFNISFAELLKIFQRLGKGALVFEMLKVGPLSEIENPEKVGFREIGPEARFCRIFERI